jgi:adenylate cyclase
VEPGATAELAEFLEAAGRGERRRLDESAPLVAALEELVLGSPRRYTRLEVLARTGVTEDEGLRLWRSLGFPEVPEDEAFFTELDVAAAELLATDPVPQSLPVDVRETVLRAIAQSMARLADWQVGMLARLFAERATEQPADEALGTVAAVLPALEQVQTYIWRRHLAAAVSRFVVGPLDDPEQTQTRTLAVGFADMVGFTRTTRRRTAAELAEMIAQFEAATTDVIAAGGGRIVKTVGDEVLFVADTVPAAAELALDLHDRVAAESALPALRIGLAAGEVLLRFGDVYGETVNIAARLTTHAHPDTVLVDRTVAEELRGDDRYRIQRLRPLQVKGYRHLQPYVLRPGD